MQFNGVPRGFLEKSPVEVPRQERLRPHFSIWRTVSPVTIRREMSDRIKALEKENDDLRTRFAEIGNFASAEEQDDDHDRD